MLSTRGLSLVALLIVTALAAESPNIDKRASLDGYEYVVVGSGAGGGPLASRLAIAGHKTLLIEAGDDQGSNINEQVPAFQGKVTEDPTIRWDYWVKHYTDDARAEQDTKATYETPSGELFVGPNPPPGSILKGILYPRAGTLGGCGSHNALITVYPHESDWANIANITGDDSWSPDAMRTYFERLEDCEYLPNSVVGHGFDGWLETTRASVDIVIEDQKIFDMLLAAASALGEGIIAGIVSAATQLTNLLLRDLNADVPGRDSSQGLYAIPLSASSISGQRSGPRDFIFATANAVNPDGSKMYPLDIRTNCLATRVLFASNSSGTTPKAIGVEFLDGQSLYSADPRFESAAGTPGNVTVSGEVILAAGAFNTPQLLKLSGIGPSAELESFGIPVVVDLPGVGTNLQDRYESSVVSKTTTNFTSTEACTFDRPGTPDPCLEQWEDQPLNRGVYATNGFAASILKTSSVAITTDQDLFLFGGPVAFQGYFPGYADVAVADAMHWTWAILKAHTGNRAGTVTLNSTDPRDMPNIDFNYFDTGTTAGGADERDLDAVVEGIALAREIYSTLVPEAGPFTEVSPGPSVSTTDEVKDFVKREAWGHHASCTCPIGADDDPLAVLDSSFRVRGVDSLRVVDASVFPQIPGIFIAVPIYMISEKAADVILQDT